MVTKLQVVYQIICETKLCVNYRCVPGSNLNMSIWHHCSPHSILAAMFRQIKYTIDCHLCCILSLKECRYCRYSWPTTSTWHHCSTHSILAATMFRQIKYTIDCHLCCIGECRYCRHSWPTLAVAIYFELLSYQYDVKDCHYWSDKAI